MKAGALVCFGVVAWSANLALAQAPAPAATAAATMSVQTLLSSGYEVKAVTELSPDAQQQIWPNTAASPEVMITLQKGQQLAICALSPLSWMNLNQTALDDPHYCKTQ